MEPGGEGNTSECLMIALREANRFRDRIRMQKVRGGSRGLPQGTGLRCPLRLFIRKRTRKASP